jgi:hypothetical protein
MSSPENQKSLNRNPLQGEMQQAMNQTKKAMLAITKNMG